MDKKIKLIGGPLAGTYTDVSTKAHFIQFPSLNNYGGFDLITYECTNNPLEYRYLNTEIKTAEKMKEDQEYMKKNWPGSYTPKSCPMCFGFRALSPKDKAREDCTICEGTGLI